jgi:hypothetical protein
VLAIVIQKLIAALIVLATKENVSLASSLIAPMETALSMKDAAVTEINVKEIRIILARMY